MHWHTIVKLEVGHVLSGTLRLVRKIADGGMGSVWIAEHLVLGTEVAVKFMSGPWAAVPSARARFLREARMTASIDSPHVVRVLDCRHDEADEPYLVLELLHGETLEQRVRRSGPLSVFETIEIVAQTCEALAATHDAHIVHRDLKPENVFLVAGSTTFVKLLDYGVAKPMNRAECLDVDLPARWNAAVHEPRAHVRAGVDRRRAPISSRWPPSRTSRSRVARRSTPSRSKASTSRSTAARSCVRASSGPSSRLRSIAGSRRRSRTTLRIASPMRDRWQTRSTTPRARRTRSSPRRPRPRMTAPASTRHPTLSELTIPLRRMRRSRKSAIAALALAAAASLLVWRSNGPELQEANASTTNTDAGVSRVVCPPATMSPATPAVVIPSNSEAARLLDGDPAKLNAAVQGIVAAGPTESPAP